VARRRYDGRTGDASNDKVRGVDLHDQVHHLDGRQESTRCSIGVLARHRSRWAAGEFADSVWRKWIVRALAAYGAAYTCRKCDVKSTTLAGRDKVSAAIVRGETPSTKRAFGSSTCGPRKRSAGINARPAQSKVGGTTSAAASNSKRPLPGPGGPSAPRSDVFGIGRVA